MSQQSSISLGDGPPEEDQSARYSIGMLNYVIVAIAVDMLVPFQSVWLFYDFSYRVDFRIYAGRQSFFGFISMVFRVLMYREWKRLGGDKNFIPSAVDKEIAHA